MPLLTRDTEIGDLLATARTIAVVGLSDNPARDSNRVAAYLTRAGYLIIPVNPAVRSVFGLKAYPRLSDVRTPIDIVDVFRRPEHMADVLDEAVAVGARALWMQPGTVHREAAERAVQTPLAVVLERCIMVEHRRLIS